MQKYLFKKGEYTMSKQSTWLDLIGLGVDILKGVAKGTSEESERQNRNYEDPEEMGKEVGRIIQKELSKAKRRKK